jgi:S-adenosylmethionine hydrolase
MQAAYVCRNIFTSFPTESFHLILVNIFDNNFNHLLLVRHQNQIIGIPDNGLITMILGDLPEQVVAIEIPKEMKKGVRTFTSILVEAFSAVASGLALEKIGRVDVKIQEKNLMRAYATDQFIEGQILMIDKFQNVIVNITVQDFEAARRGRRFKIVVLGGTFIETISDHYADVSEGEKLAFFNEAGYLEIAINKGYAASLFGLGEFGSAGGAPQGRRQYYQTIKAFFE